MVVIMMVEFYTDAGKACVELQLVTEEENIPGYKDLLCQPSRTFF